MSSQHDPEDCFTCNFYWPCEQDEEWGLRDGRKHEICMHCGEEIALHGPEIFHTKSTMIRCDNTAGTKAARAIPNGGK